MTTTTDRATYKFETSDAAWTFMRAMEAAKVQAGYPSYLTHTVQVSIATWMDRETADKAAGGAPCIDYEFKGAKIPEHIARILAT